MKKLSKILAIILVFISISTMFTGCSVDELNLLDAMLKSQSITSMESKTDLSIKLDVSDLSEEEMQRSAALLMFLNNLNITFNQKLVRDADTGAVKAEILASSDLGGIPVNANLWLETGISNNEPYVKEIFQLPSLAKMALGDEISGKDYLVLNSPSIPAQSTSITNPFGYNNYLNFNKELNELTAQFYLKYAKNLKSDFNIAKRTGTVSKDGKILDTYQLKISDSVLKDFISFIVNDLNTNIENQKLIKEYMITLTKLSSYSNPELDLTDEETEESFTEFEEGLSEFVEEFNKTMDHLKNVTILGKDGITIDYVVNEKGFIVGNSGTFDIDLDLGKFSEAMSNNETVSEQSSGKIKLKITSKTEISKINEKIDIAFPVLTEDNSIDYLRLMEKQFENDYDIYDEFEDKVTVIINGESVDFDNAPVIRDGRTLVPAREVFEALDGNIEWNDSSQTVTSYVQNNKIVFTIDSNEATINGESKKLDVPATLINDRAYVPLRFLSESVGGKLIWIEEAKMAIIEF